MLDITKIIMLLIAICLDFAGLILFVLSLVGIGLPFSFLLDLIGNLTIGLWLILKKGNPGPAGATKGFAKIAQKLGISTAVELVPFVGDLAPSWFLLVASEIGILKIPFLS